MARLHDQRFSDDPTLHDWRVVRKAAHTRFRAVDATASVGAFVSAALARAADAAADLDVDVRAGGVVGMRLGSFEARSLQDGDVIAARGISTLAADHGFVADTSAVAQTDIGIDAMDIELVLPFWRALLGYVDEPTPPGVPVDAIVDPARVNVSIWFQQMDAPRPQRNRIHFDLNVPHDQARARIDAALAAGGRLLDESHARAFWVLADPEGNEACVCTWQDRD